MASPSASVLRKDIVDILKDADLATLSSKKVRLQLSEKYSCDLQNRKDEIDSIIMEVISSSQNDAKKPTTKQPEPAKASCSSAKPSTINGRTKKESDGDDDKSDSNMEDDKDSDVGSDSEPMDDEALARKLQEEESKKNRKTRNAAQSESSRKRKRPKSEASVKSGSKAPKQKRTNKYMEPCVLSPVLADIVGKPECPRHEVVKKMWSIIKERNLADPKNKQFMLCDEQLMKVFGRKRVRTFGMMKFLKDHIHSPDELNH